MPVIEIVNFSLAGADAPAFLDANAEISQWLSQQPGFCGRRLAQGDDGRFIDIIEWRSRDDASAAAGKMQTMAGSFEAMSMIEMATMAMSHVELVLSTDAG